MTSSGPGFPSVSGSDAPTSSVEYHSPTDTFWTEFEMTTRPVSEAVISAVAQATEKDPLDLPPLYEFIDPAALNALFVSTTPKPERSEVKVTFEYAGYRVIVNGHGTVQVKASDAST